MAISKLQEHTSYYPAIFIRMNLFVLGKNYSVQPFSRQNEKVTLATVLRFSHLDFKIISSLLQCSGCA